MLLRAHTLLLIALIDGTATAYSQSSPSNSRLMIQGPAVQAGGLAKDALGRPCVDVEAAARPETVNPDMLDHVISLKNTCPKLVKAKVCYYNSDRCRDVSLDPYKRVDTILGTMRGIKFFRYTLTTK